MTGESQGRDNISSLLLPTCIIKLGSARHSLLPENCWESPLTPQGPCGFKQLTPGKSAAVGRKTPKWFLSLETYFLKVNVGPEVL